MTLKEYIKQNGLSYAEAARGIGVSTMAVFYWSSGKRMPRPEYMSKITEFTNGQVTANDFYCQSREP